MEKLCILIICMFIMLYIGGDNINLVKECEMQEIMIRNIPIQYSNISIKIIDSYIIEDDILMRVTLEDFKFRTGYCSKRSISSWVKEWKAHNRLYKLGLFKAHTKDCDLDEHEKWWRLLAYQILGI